MASIDNTQRDQLHAARRAMAKAMSHDQRRLHQLWSQWQHAAEPARAAARDAFETALAASQRQRAARAQEQFTLTFDPQLPIAQEQVRAEIIAAIKTRQVIVIAGETGSGKTTQIPKLCLSAQRGVAGMIGCTQPRRIAARAVATRVAHELGQPVGGIVGSQVRFNACVSEQTRIKFMTDGILLAEIANDRWLSGYDTLIIDEAHERSLNIDFILGYLKQLLQRRKDLQVIVTSATIDTARFSHFFDNALTIHVQGRTYPVTLRYRPLTALVDSEKKGRNDVTIEQAILAAISEMSTEDPRGDILVFLPGEREIRQLHQTLARSQLPHTQILPLYARLSGVDQQRIFQPASQRRIVLATNVAETSLTVPGIRTVIDPGIARIKRYSPRQKIDRLLVEPISQASANQRSGRCGRVAAGVCYRLYAEEDFLARPLFTDAEIHRSSLAGVILQMLDLRLGPVEEFPFIEPPNPRAIADGWQQLTDLGAIDGQRRLTSVGRQMARIPLDVKLARMVVGAQANGCLRPVLVITAFLAIQDPRERPHEARQAADRAHAQFADRQSEFVAILRLWQAFSSASADLTRNQLRQWSSARFLNLMRLLEWRELHRQLRLVCEQFDWREEPSSDVMSILLAANDASSCASPRPTRGELHRQARLARQQRQAGGSQTPQLSSQADDAPAAGAPDARSIATAYRTVHCALLAGLPSQLGRRSDNGDFHAPRQRRFQLFPGSSLARTPPSWVVTAILLETQKVWGVINARIEPEWAVRTFAHAISHSYHNPFWLRKRGNVLVSMQSSLHGLVLIPKQLVPFGPIDADAAHDLFIRQALVTGDIQTRAECVAANLSTLERAREQEAKRRRIGLIVDEEVQIRWYAERLPKTIHSAAGLDAWWSKAAPAERQRLYWSAEEVTCGDNTPTELYPSALPVGANQLALTYRFEPGESDDGVTLDVPLSLLHALDATRLSWLTPGFVVEKATALIRSLPKTRRKSYVPAPAFAQAFFEAYPTPTMDSLEAELARFLTRSTGVALTAEEFDPTALDAHLTVNIRLCDETGEVITQSRDYQALCQVHGAEATAAFAQQVNDPQLQTPIDHFPTEPIAPSLIQAGVVAYPALVDLGERVELHLFPNEEQARLQHCHGVARLIRRALTKQHAQACKQLPIAAPIALLYAAIESHASLRTDIVDLALAALLAESDLTQMRTHDAFRDCCAQVSGKLFQSAVALLRTVEAILDLYPLVKESMKPHLAARSTDSLDDMHQQLEGLIYPGFLRQTPPDHLSHYPRYLRGLVIRAERALHHPARDRARILTLRPVMDAFAQVRAKQRDTPHRWQAIRWDLEELRIATFAQELGARAGVSLPKLSQRLAALQNKSPQ